MWLLLESFEKEYKEAMGKNVPYRALGFSSTYDLMQHSPEVVEVRELGGGHVVLVAVPDKNTEHMARMVSNQRNKTAGYNYRTGQVMDQLSGREKQQLQAVGGRRSRQVPNFLKEQVVQMLGEHGEGLDLREFLQTYHNKFDYGLEVSSYGFSGLEDFLHHGQ